ncbi:hypothetical protein PTTG_03069, partial [Puccinia triticina 1-1 BBBD Race 1]
MWDRALDKRGMLIFAEGTLISALMRPASTRFAAKPAIDDLKHYLLPQSTGSLLCPLALSQKVPNLQLVNLTIGYPGVLPGGYAPPPPPLSPRVKGEHRSRAALDYRYGQDYFMLQSIFGHSHPPRKVHIHIMKILVVAIPISLFPSSSQDPATPAQEPKKETGMVDPPHKEIARPQPALSLRLTAFIHHPKNSLDAPVVWPWAWPAPLPLPLSLLL